MSDVDSPEATPGCFTCITALRHRRSSHPQVMPSRTLTSEEIASLRYTWSLLETQMEVLGMSALLALFQVRQDLLANIIPEARDHANIEGHEWNREMLRTSALRTMDLLDKALANLENPHVLRDIMDREGSSERKTLLCQLGPHFVSTIEPMLTVENEWNDHVNTAWNTFFEIVAVL